MSVPRWTTLYDLVNPGCNSVAHVCFASRYKHFHLNLSKSGPYNELSKRTYSTENFPAAQQYLLGSGAGCTVLPRRHPRIRVTKIPKNAWKNVIYVADWRVSGFGNIGDDLDAGHYKHVYLISHQAGI